jgi:hypothetical protein
VMLQVQLSFVVNLLNVFLMTSKFFFKVPITIPVPSVITGMTSDYISHSTFVICQYIDSYILASFIFYHHHYWWWLWWWWWWWLGGCGSSSSSSK